MVTLTKYGAKYNRNILFLEGLSTDTKPTDEFDGLSIQNGSEYTEVDTGKKFLYDYDNATWYEVQTGGGGGGGFTPTTAQLAAMNSGITAEKLQTDENNISTVQTSLEVGQNDDGKVLTATYSGGTGTYSWITPTAIKSYIVSKPQDGSVSTATFDWSQLATGRTYLISCRNHTGMTSRYGISIYTFVKISDDSLELWTPISDITNAKITSYVISNNTLTLTYDVQGYHTVKIVDFNI